ncbi:hypothetical protein EDEG_00579 [Edhazardia aedis USNM 41457]|uniref:N-alpha-acetyltransferase 40 n=1 Tax=Edhazardia aedis (strain USNM 41457) TaxID=1003232 RepID=J9DCB1_EDHAE|nr:hypothetical protein EDEG_00579 [Edhazardia aedis USNM 41457]|eukprot:EJW05381.1 hypothetical protein EDEG_00579 [Edhazardia aedis USNM 41457]
MTTSEKISSLSGYEISESNIAWCIETTVDNMSIYVKKHLLKNAKKKSLQNKQNHFLLYFVENELKGFLMYRIEKNNVCFIYEIQVARDYQRQKIGSKLLLNFLKNMEDINKIEIFLNVYRSNESAIRFYEAHGFVKDERFNDIKSLIMKHKHS